MYGDGHFPFQVRLTKYDVLFLEICKGVKCVFIYQQRSVYTCLPVYQPDAAFNRDGC